MFFYLSTFPCRNRLFFIGNNPANFNFILLALVKNEVILNRILNIKIIFIYFIDKLLIIHKQMKALIPNTDITVDDIHRLVAPLREKGKRLVTTNGCFDLLHYGHIKYLYDAAMLGDILVVGVNADSSVKKLKGEKRPVQNQRDRLFIISSLKVVDYAFIFYEDNPCFFLEILRPDVHVKGGDYRVEDLPETEVVEKYGGRVRIVPFTQGYSTSLLIDRVLYGRGIEGGEKN